MLRLCDVSVHVSATCHLSVKTNDFVAAACRWDVSLRHDPSCARTFNHLFSHLGDMQQGHVAGTHVVATKSHYVHTNMSPMCEQHIIYWLQHVAAACPCVMTHRVREPLNWRAYK